MHDPPMETLGRYVLSDRLASGGMAEIWRGAITGPGGFSRPLAIKRIRAEHAADHDFIRMLMDEARIASTLHHPNIVSVIEFGQDKGEWFIAMEYVSGRHLGSVVADSIRAGSHIPLPLALYISREACLGLAHAHTRKDHTGTPLGIVHRDISPQNILVGYDGAVRVADFGIAKAARRVSHTDGGALKGKYAYMSPEQSRGHDVDARTDLFAMGVVMWEVLAGRRMFPVSMDPILVLEQIRAGNFPNLADVAPRVSPEVRKVVEGALEPDPDRRTPDAATLAGQLGYALGVLAPGYTSLDATRFMRERFGPEIDSEALKLASLDSLARRATVSAMNALTPSASVPAQPVVPADSHATQIIADSDDQDTGAMLMPPPAAPAPRQRHEALRRGSAIGAFALGLSAVLAVGVWTVVQRTRAGAGHAGAKPVAAGAAKVDPQAASGGTSGPAGNSSSAANVAARMGVLVVDTVPAGADVMVDGRAVGNAPLTVNLERGTQHTLAASMPGRQVARQTITLQGEQEAVLLELPRPE